MAVWLVGGAEKFATGKARRRKEGRGGKEERGWKTYHTRGGRPDQ